MKKIKTLACCLIAVITLCSLNVNASQSGTVGEPEYIPSTSRFERGTYAPTWQVTSGATVNDSSFYNGLYTKMSNLASGSSHSQYGSVELVNRCKFPNGDLQTIGLENDIISDVTLKMRLKLDDIRNKDLEIAFSHMSDANGNAVVSGDYSDSTKRMDFCKPNDSLSRYISIGHAVTATTEWQTVEVTLDLSEYTQVTHWNSSYQSLYKPANWANATAIHIASRKTKNAFSDTTNPATSILICYGDIELTFNKAKKCNVTIDMFDSSGTTPLNTITPNGVIIPKAVFSNETSSTNQALVMFAAYKNGVMVALNADIAEVPASSSPSISLPSFTLPSDLTGYEVIMYIWSDFVNMQPITKHLYFQS